MPTNGAASDIAAQFDVVRNPSPRTRAAIPYLLIVQSNLLWHTDRRLVVPLALSSSIRKLDPTLNPIFQLEGRDCAMLPTDIVAVPRHGLGQRVTNVASDGDRIIAAIDLLIART